MANRELQLPAWAKMGPATEKLSVIIEADTDGYVKEWLELLGVEEPDQYWLEVAYQCAKMDLQMAIAGTEYDSRSGKSAEFRFSKASQWKLTEFPAGRGIEKATKGLEARSHYQRIRNALPS